MTLPQGDLGLLDTDAAQRLLAARINARLAYTGLDGKPRVLPIWFHWTGEELVMASFAGAAKARALRANPAVAVTIDTEAFPADVLLLRGAASVSDVEGLVPEYRAAARRYLGEQGAAAFASRFEGQDVRMHRIALRPEWVALLDFQTRLPAVLGGIQG